MAWPWFLFEVEHGAGAREVTGGGWGGLEALSVGGGGSILSHQRIHARLLTRQLPNLPKIKTARHSYASPTDQGT